MRTMLSILFLIFLGMAGTVHATDIPYVTPEMRKPDYWILKNPSPDKIVMTPQEIISFNKGLCRKGLCDDLAALPPVMAGDDISAGIQALAMEVSVRDLFQRDGSPADEALYDAWTRNMALDALPRHAALRYAFTVTFTNERIFPTDDPLYEKPGDVHFDQVQNSGLDPATPVVVLHQSADKEWFFIKDGIASGWVKRGDIAFCDRGAWLQAMTEKDRVVVLSARTSIYLDRSMNRPEASARMGSHFTFSRVGPDFVEILYPLRHTDGTARFVHAFVSPRDVMQGFLPYTPRMVITQAFKLLDAPYGWGDMNGDQDCSRFIHMVFATMGLELPRNSAEQGRAGLSLAEFNQGAPAGEKFALIAGHGIGALTLLRLKGHIMLYLGQADGRLYAIHAVWAYRHKDAEDEKTEILGRVVVSDLSLGEGSSKGSLLERIVAVRFLKDGDQLPGEGKDNH